MNGPDRLPWRAALLAELLAAAGSDGSATATAGDSSRSSECPTNPNRPLFASLLAGQASGYGCLPTRLGLAEADYRSLLAENFPACRADALAASPLFGNRLEIIPELSDLQQLLIDHRANARASEVWMATIVATACAGRDHLWQDLGLANRNELSQLMMLNFPELARANSTDMKWKKFLYRQLCAREGIYVCPAPSCGECTDYAKCFGPEN